MSNVFMKEQVIIRTVCQYETRRCGNACLERISIQTKPGLIHEVFMAWKFETLFIDNPFMLNITTCNAKHTYYVATLFSHNETFIDTDQNVNLFEDWKSNLSFM